MKVLSKTDKFFSIERNDGQFASIAVMFLKILYQTKKSLSCRWQKRNYPQGYFKNQ